MDSGGLESSSAMEEADEQSASQESGNEAPELADTVTSEQTELHSAATCMDVGPSVSVVEAAPEECVPAAEPVLTDTAPQHATQPDPRNMEMAGCQVSSPPVDSADPPNMTDVVVDACCEGSEGQGTTEIDASSKSLGVTSPGVNVSSPEKQPTTNESLGGTLMTAGRVPLAYRTDDSNCESSDHSQDSSDDSADIEESSSSEGGPSAIRKLRHTPKTKKKVADERPEEPLEDLRTRGELGLADLPPIEELKITVDDNVALHVIGKIINTIDVLVVIQAERNLPALDSDTILFMEGKIPIGMVPDIYRKSKSILYLQTPCRHLSPGHQQVFETFGPVTAPLYSVRFNRPEDITKRGLQVGQEVFYAPEMETFTKYVFVTQLRKMQGSDASWEDNNEPNEKHLAYSDDEQERLARAKLRRRGKEDGEEDGFDEDGMPDTPGKKKKKRKPMKKKPMNGYTADISESSDGFQSTGQSDGQSGPLILPQRFPGGRHGAWQWQSGRSNPQWPPGNSTPRWRAPPPPSGTRPWLHSPRLGNPSHRPRPNSRGDAHPSWQSRESRQQSRSNNTMDNRWQGYFNNNQSPNSHIRMFGKGSGPRGPPDQCYPSSSGSYPGPQGDGPQRYGMNPPVYFPPQLQMDNMGGNCNPAPLRNHSDSPPLMPPPPPRDPHFSPRDTSEDFRFGPTGSLDSRYIQNHSQRFPGNEDCFRHPGPPENIQPQFGGDPSFPPGPHHLWPGHDWQGAPN